MKHYIEKLFVVTVNWNQPVLTEQCILSILQNNLPASNIVLVDNGSSDHSLKYLKDSFPTIKIVVSNQNMGFARGFNQGIGCALELGAEYLFIVNNDTEIPKNMINVLYKETKLLKADISAPAIFFADRPDQLWSAGGDFCNFLAAPINAHNRNKPLPQNPIRREFLSGCALLIHRNVFNTIGVFDEDYFLYYEDLDFVKRAQTANLNLWLIPDAKIFHHVSASSQGETSPAVYYWKSRSSWVYFRKHAKLWQWFFIIPWRIGHTMKTLLKLFRHKQFKRIVPYLTGFLMIKNERFYQPQIFEEDGLRSKKSSNEILS